MHKFWLIGSALMATAASTPVLATIPGQQPFDNYQPSLAVTEITPTSGIFPSGGGGSSSGDTLGFIYQFAGNYVPDGSLSAQGQTLPIAQNTALFSLLGTTYGGDGISTFALPNLTLKTVIGTGSGAPTLGSNLGSATVLLSSAQLPPPQGGGQPFDNVQPSLAMQPLIATSGVFPLQGGNSGSAAFLGQIADFSGAYIPSGWAAANGQLLSITANPALFSILGTTYGGNGVSTFALPDLTNRVAVGADASHPLGSVFGTNNSVLTTAQANGNAPVSNYQASLAVEYLIATSGIFPLHGGTGSSLDSATPTLGEITAFAGNYVPSGWALANGQLLSIASNQALFAIIGTTYGGDGITTFALPNLQGRALIGSDFSSVPVGTVLGGGQITLSQANLPSVPLPGTGLMLLSGLCFLGNLARRREPLK